MHNKVTTAQIEPPN